MFITVEGGEGAGKSTQVRLLADALAASGYAVLRTREPGGAPGAEALRELLLRGAGDWSPMAETLLHFAARAEHVSRTIQPALDAGMVVLCDRYIDSTMAYQAHAGGGDPATVTTLARLIGLEPDLTLILSVSEQVAGQRLVARRLAPDRYERRGPQFHRGVAEGFRRIAAANPHRCVLLDADGSVEAIHAAMLATVERHLAAR